ncbi:hypothetical protein SNL152K_80 [Streptomyces sp. NL15-2K]|nr:hypothetical protein SNL152K_80 [Streptomyces sp. NL15-2K]
MVLTVENTGEKLTPELASTLTEPFQRGTERIHADHAGVGLGLAIVKTITHAHDGTLTLTPRSAGGIRVTVELPSRCASAVAHLTPRRAPAPLSQSSRARSLAPWLPLIRLLTRRSTSRGWSSAT